MADSLPSAEVAAGTSVTDALVAVGLVESRSEARRAIADGGAYLNNVAVADPELALTRASALAGGWIVVRRGKKTVGLVRVGE